MYSVTYERPATLADAVRLLKTSGGRALAGGQSLVGAMKLRLADHGTVVDLGAIAELRGIRREGNAIVIGAMTRHAEVAESSDVRAAIPGLARLAEGIADRQVRNMGTLGGSLANNDPAACHAAGVLALGASIQTTQRLIAADDFFLGMYETALEEGELITAVHFPIPIAAGYVKFEQPASQFALVGVCVAKTQSGVRVAVTGAKSCVYRCPELEQALQASFTPQAARAVRVSADDLSSDLHATAEYRAHLIPVICARAVARASGG
jgi:aerobic carbon-monoxide dehydrogenase medium subunit